MGEGGEKVGTLTSMYSQPIRRVDVYLKCSIFLCSVWLTVFMLPSV